jgi:uncharacterized protein YutE (UPF0331/DUF86 family)
MMDTTILSKIQDLERYVQQLRKFQNYSCDEIESDPSLRSRAGLEKIWAIEHGLQVSIQIVIDIGNHILASIGENQVEDYTGIIDKLGRYNILPSQFAKEIRGMAAFRNILVHQYADVNLRTVYYVLQNKLDDFVNYIRYIQSYFSSKQSRTPTDSMNQPACANGRPVCLRHRQAGRGLRECYHKRKS